MADKPASPQQGDSGGGSAQQQGAVPQRTPQQKQGDGSTTPQADQPIFRDWAAI